MDFLLCKLFFRDERYSHLIGRTAWHPFRQEEIPIIADTYIDPAFGTGAVKITPAHDPNDFEMGARHSLKSINILNPDGTLNEIVSEFCGQHRFSVRESICARLDELGLYRGEREHAMSVPVCGRTGDIVEPMMKFQVKISHFLKSFRFYCFRQCLGFFSFLCGSGS